MCDNFAQHFMNKVEITLVVKNKNFNGELFLSFSCISKTQVFDLLTLSRSTTCSLDPIPTPLLKKCKSTALDFITAIINKSFIFSKFPSSFIITIIRPPLKNSNGNSEDVSNYRLVSNWCFISKTLEKIAAESQIKEHIISHNLSDPFQSAYRAYHSTKTSLIKVLADILKSIDSKKTVALLLLRGQSGESVRLGSCRLGFDSESGQTNDFKIGIHSSLLDAQH